METNEKALSKFSEETLNEMELENVEGGANGDSVNKKCPTNNCSGGNCSGGCGISSPIATPTTVDTPIVI